MRLGLLQEPSLRPGFPSRWFRSSGSSSSSLWSFVVLTLAVRLYGNMLAGHMILGIFGIMTQCFILDRRSVRLLRLIAACRRIAWFVLLVRHVRSWSAWWRFSRRSCSPSSRPSYVNTGNVRALRPRVFIAPREFRRTSRLWFRCRAAPRADIIQVNSD